MNKKAKALLDSKVDLMEYFLGPDPKKTSYYKSTVRKKSILNDFWVDSYITVHSLQAKRLPIVYNRYISNSPPLQHA